MKPERIVLCEGYHDRAFWQGALEHLGCRDPGADPVLRRTVLDPGGRAVTRGDFAFDTTGGAFVRVRPCRGDRALVLAELRRLLRELATRPVERFIVSIDDDGDARAGARHRGLPDAVRAAVAAVDAGATANQQGDLLAGGGATVVSATAWWTPDAHGAALPWKQTLERLASAAVDAAYPGRGAAVGAWLAGAPHTDLPKAFAWSHMAGWYPEDGCEGFYRFIWRDAGIAAQLQTRLAACGAWRLMQAMSA